MITSLDELKVAASSLPLPERAELAHFLLRTFEPVESGAAEAWLAVATQRMDDVYAGKVIGLPAEQVMEDLRRQPD